MPCACKCADSSSTRGETKQSVQTEYDKERSSLLETQTLRRRADFMHSSLRPQCVHGSAVSFICLFAEKMLVEGLNRRLPYMLCKPGGDSFLSPFFSRNCRPYLNLLICREYTSVVVSISRNYHHCSAYVHVLIVVLLLNPFNTCT